MERSGEHGQSGQSSGIPVDPDVEAVAGSCGPERPPHLRWGYIGLVGLGGAVGTAGRAWLTAVFPAAGGVNWVIFWVNVTGAFLLGLLLEALAHRGPDRGGLRVVRLTVGTGVLGGFTTYSTLTDDTARLLEAGRWDAGTGYAVLTVGAGLVAVVAGVLLAALLRPGSRQNRPPGPGQPRRGGQPEASS